MIFTFRSMAVGFAFAILAVLLVSQSVADSR